MNESRKSNIHKMAKIAILAAIAVIIMLFEIPLPFAPAFYKIDLSEVVVLLGSFAMGPVAGILIEALEILLNLLLNGTDTAGIGELANFLIGLSFVLPAAAFYFRKKTLKHAVLGMVMGTLIMTLVGTAMNYYLLIPAYSHFYGMPIDALIGMGTAVNSHIVDLKTLVFFATAPFNLVKGFVSSLLVLLTYKKLSPILHK